MTPGDKELLIKDLCARLPYCVKCEVIKRDIDGEMLFMRDGSHALELTVDNVKGLVTNDAYDIKPYLFPLSSMTEEQKREFDISMDMGYAAAYNAEINCANRMIDFFYENHLDYRGLIPMGLANDATGLNIY